MPVVALLLMDLPLNITDGLSNLLTSARSTIDPLARNEIIADCDVDRLTWYHNGGIASTIVDFWPELTGSGIDISVMDEQTAKTEKEAQNLADYLMQRYKELGLLRHLIKADIRSQVLPFGLIGINAGGSWDKEILPAGGGSNYIASLSSMDCQQYQLDKATNNYTFHGSTVVNGSRLLNMLGRARLDCVYLAGGGGNSSATSTTLPFIDSQTVQAAIEYDQAVHAIGVLIQKKNFLAMGVNGFLSNMMKAGNEEYAARVVELVSNIQKTSSILNVEIFDKNDMELKVIERDLGQLDNAIDRMRDRLLASTNNIPETRLFGRARTGGLSGAQDDDDRVNSEANRLFSSRWLPLINQLNLLLVNEPSCPSRKALSKLAISRIDSGKPTTKLELARIRLINAQAEKIELENQRGAVASAAVNA